MRQHCRLIPPREEERRQIGFEKGNLGLEEVDLGGDSPALEEPDLGEDSPALGKDHRVDLQADSHSDPMEKQC